MVLFVQVAGWIVKSITSELWILHLNYWHIKSYSGPSASRASRICDVLGVISKPSLLDVRGEYTCPTYCLRLGQGDGSLLITLADWNVLLIVELRLVKSRYTTVMMPIVLHQTGIRQIAATMLSSHILCLSGGAFDEDRMGSRQILWESDIKERQSVTVFTKRSLNEITNQDHQIPSWDQFVWFGAWEFYRIWSLYLHRFSDGSA